MASETFFKVSISGQAIMDAVRSLAKEFISKKDWIDGKDVFMIGQRSDYPYEHLIVLADRKKTIDPATIYQEVTVEEYKWGGGVFAIGYDQSAVINTVKEFAKKLKECLNLEEESNSEEKWISFHEVARQLLEEYPRKHFYTLVRIYAEKIKVSASDASTLFASFVLARGKVSFENMPKDANELFTKAIDKLSVQRP